MDSKDGEGQEKIQPTINKGTSGVFRLANGATANLQRINYNHRHLNYKTTRTSDDIVRHQMIPLPLSMPHNCFH